MAKQFKSFDDYQNEPQPSQETSQFKSFDEFEAPQIEPQQAAYNALKDDFGGFVAGATDKMARLISGFADMAQKTVVDAPKAISFWLASKLSGEEFETPEEKKAAYDAIGAMTSTFAPASAAFEEITDVVQEELDPLINKHEGKDFIQLAEEGSILAATDAFVGDVASALPSVAAAFAGPAGLAAIGGSAFGGKFEEQIEKGVNASTDEILLNSLSSATGEIASEAITAGLGKGIGVIANKLGPVAAKAIMRNTGTKLATAFGLEGLSEVAAEAWDKAGDHLIIGDEKAFEGAKRDFFKTFLLGGVIGSGITTVEIASPAAKRAVVKEFTPKPIQKSQKEAMGNINALYEEYLEASAKGDDKAAEALLNQIEGINKGLGKSEKTVEEQIDKLDNEELQEMESITNEWDALNQWEQENKEANRVSKEAIRIKKEELEAKQEEVFTNPLLDDVVKKEPITEKGKKASEKVQKLYDEGVNEEGELDIDTRNEIIEEFRPTAAKLARQRWYEIPANLRRGTLEEFTNALLWDETQGVRSFVRTYKQGATPLGAFVNQNLKNRAIKLKEIFTAETDTGVDTIPGGGPTTGDPIPTAEKAIDTAVANIGLNPLTIDKAKESAGLLPEKIKEVKNIKKWNQLKTKFQKDFLREEFRKVIKPRKSEVGPKWDTQYAEYVKANAENLRNLYMLRPGFTKSTRGITSTWSAQNVPTPKEFRDYFLGTDIDLNTKKGQGELGSRKNTMIDVLSQSVGDKYWRDFLKANPDIQAQINALNIQKSLRAAEDIKPGASTDYAFQEDTEPADSDFAAQSQVTNKLLEENKLGKMPDSKDAKEYAEMQEFVSGVLPQWFPRSFFNAGNFWNAGKSAAQRGFFFTNEADFDAATENVEFADETGVFDKMQRYNYKAKTIDGLLGDKSLIKTRNEANQAAFNEMWRIFDNMIKADKKNARMIAAFLKSAQNSQNHLSRIGAPLVGYSNTGPYVEEHAMPQAAVSRYLLQTALTGGNIDTALKNTNKNFVQIALNKTDDASLKQNKIGPNGSNLNSNMPAGWKPSDNWLARYFNNTSNIDPNSITFLETGKTVAETYAPRITQSKKPLLDEATFSRKGSDFGTYAEATLGQPGSKGVAEANADFVKYIAEKGLIDKGKPGKYDLDQQIWKTALSRYKAFPKKLGEGGLSEGSFNNSVSVYFHPAFKDAISAYGKVLRGVNKYKEAHGKITPAHQEILDKRWGEIETIAKDWDAIHTGGKIARQLKVADQVSDPVKKGLDEGLAMKHFIEQVKDTPDHAVEAITRLLQNGWKGVTEVTSDFEAAKQHLMDQGWGEFDAFEMVTNTYGFASGSFIYLSPDTKLDTPMHEFTHIWNSVISQRAPRFFKGIYHKIKTESPDLYEDQVTRMRRHGYDYKEDSHEWMDEVIAGIIGNHGEATLKQGKDAPKKDASFFKLVTEYYKKLAKLLGFDPQGKNINELTVGETLDLILDEVVNGKPGNNLKKLSKDGWAQLSLAHRKGTIAFSLKNNADFNSLKSVREKYLEHGDLAKAINDSFNEFKDNWGDFDQFAAFVKDSIKVKVGKSNDIIIAEAAAIESKAKEIRAKDETNTLRDKFEEILNKGAGRKPSSIFVTPNFEDFSGLLDTLLPKGGKAGAAAQKWLQDTLVTPYISALNAVEGQTANVSKAWKAITKGMNLNQSIIDGYTLGDAILNEVAKREGKDIGIPEEIAGDLANAVHANVAFPAVDYLIDGVGLVASSDMIGKPINRSVFTEANRNARANHMADFKDNVDAIFDDKMWAKIRASKGDQYAKVLENTLDRMKKGRNRNAVDHEANVWTKWLGRAVGTTMFFNTRSAALQLISTMNYVLKPGMGYSKLAGTWTTNRKEAKKAAKELLATGYMKNRVSGDKFDLLADEIGRGDSWIDKMLKGGFSLTKWGDKSAIIWGGVPYYLTRQSQLKKENPDWTEAQVKQQAVVDFISATEESQQSADPARISQVQSSSIGKIIYAFANTPFQYTRIMKKRINDLASGRSKAKGTTANDVRELMWYSATQSAVFYGLQSGLAALAYFGDDDEKEKEKVGYMIDGYLTSLLKTFGNWGTATAAMYNVLDAAFIEGKTADKAALKGLGISPPLQIKFGDLKNAIQASKKAYDDNDWKQGLSATGDALSFSAGIPLDRAIKKANNLATWFNTEADLWQKIGRSLGYSDFDIGGGNLLLPEYKGKKKPSKFESKFNNKENKFGSDKFGSKKFESPLDRETGQAFADGSIEIDPNLSPEEFAKTYAHEMQHVEDMEEHGLDYDDNNVYWEGSAFKRKGGMIEYNGKMVQEGHPSLPWERRAFQAEKGV